MHPEVRGYVRIWYHIPLVSYRWTVGVGDYDYDHDNNGINNHDEQMITPQSSLTESVAHWLGHTLNQSWVNVRVTDCLWLWVSD